MSLLQTHALDAPNSRAIARQLLELAQDPDNQPFIAQEKGCLAGLVGYVVHPDADVALMASRTLEFLASHPQNKRSMREFPGLLDALNEAHSRPDGNERTKEFAGNALVRLGVALPRATTGQPAPAAPQGENAPHAHNTAERVAGDFASKKYYTLTLAVEGLDDNGTAVVVQRVLVNVRGVVSVALQRERGLAVVGTRGDALSLDDLCDTLARAGISSTSWPPPAPPAIATVHGPSANESQLSSGPGASPAPAASGSPASNSHDDSGYLNEADYSSDSVHEGTIARWGVSSLEARLAEQRREEELRAEKTERLLSKVTSIVSSAGSWLMGW